MNIYRHSFTNTCPNNGQVINYNLKIETTGTIMVENIVSACVAREPSYHEQLADELYEALGPGRQTLIAYHHGVWIETNRGFY